MPSRGKQIPVTPGRGELRFSGFRGLVQYELQGEPSALKPGAARLRGSIMTEPEIAARAFREGEAFLALEDGAQFRLTMLGHSAGSGTAYFEMRV